MRAQGHDELLFKYATDRIMKQIESFHVRLLADIIHTHHELGLKNEAFFACARPRIIARQKELNEKAMGHVIRAYARFMIPLKEESQGFRTMAIVAKGDFMRPSEKPKRTGKKTFDKPVALYEKTQVHTRG